MTCARATYAALACWAVLTCLRASLFLVASVGAAATVRREAKSAGLVVSRRFASATRISCTCCRTHRTRTKTHRNQRMQRNAIHESSGRTDLGVFGVPMGQLGGGHLQVDPPLDARDQAADGRTVACASRHRSCKNEKNEKRRKNERRQKNEASTGVDGTGDSVEIGLERSAVGHQLSLGRGSNRRRQA